MQFEKPSTIFETKFLKVFRGCSLRSRLQSKDAIEALKLYSVLDRIKAILEIPCGIPGRYLNYKQKIECRQWAERLVEGLKNNGQRLCEVRMGWSLSHEVKKILNQMVRGIKICVMTIFLCQTVTKRQCQITLASVISDNCVYISDIQL